MRCVVTHAKRSIWTVLVLLAACAGTADPKHTREAGGELPASLRLPHASAFPIRIGIEHVELGNPLEGRSAAPDPARATASRSERGGAPLPEAGGGSERERKRDASGKSRYGFDLSRPIERMTDRYLEELTGYDQRHQPRNFDQIGVLNRLRSFAEIGSASWQDEREREIEDRLIERWQGRLLTRPMAIALRELPVAHELEEGLELFKSDHVPLSDPYRESHKSGPDLGRLSLRVRAGSGTDPIEVVYLRGIWRVGTSQNNLKLGTAIPLAEDLSLSLRGKYRYDAATWEIDSTLVWQIGRRYRANLLLSNHMDQLAEPTAFSASSTTFENSNGMMFFFEYLF